MTYLNIERTSQPRISNLYGKRSRISNFSRNSDRRYKLRDSSSRGYAESMWESALDIPHESEGFAVHSDLKFLYQIGRICAESGKYLEEGILCLDDYINLINFFYPTDSQQTGKIAEMKIKAIYMVGLIFYQVKDYDQAFLYLEKIKDDLLEIDDVEKYYKCEQILAEIADTKFY